MIPTIKSLSDQLSVGSTRLDMQQGFRINDATNAGICQRDDFINSVFDSVRGLKAADLLKLLTTFADEYDTMVNYADFMRLVERQGQLGGLEF